MAKRREPRTSVRPGIPQTDLPAKEPGKHRWVATAGYVLTAQQISAAVAGSSVTLSPSNMFMLGSGCYDCEQIFGEHEPECPVGDADAEPTRGRSELHPIPGDVAEAQMAVEVAGQNHLLVQEVTTSAAMTRSPEGVDRPVVLLSLAGRFNKSEVTGSQDSILRLDAAVKLHEVLEHTLKFLSQLPDPE